MRATNPHFMNGVPELLILRCLQEREMYGYELVQAIQDKTDSVIILSEGAIYPVLHALAHEGALQSSRKTVQGRTRVYYSITPAGVGRFSELAKTWTTLTEAIDALMRKTSHDRPL